MITDATCTPVNIKFPQDTHLLNQARTNLEDDIKVMAKQLQIATPRTYKREAHAKWTAFSRKPRRWGKLGSLSTGVDEVIFRIQFIYELGSFFRF